MHVRMTGSSLKVLLPAAGFALPASRKVVQQLRSVACHALVPCSAPQLLGLHGLLQLHTPSKELVPEG